MTLSNRKIILGITGGIAAYKSAYLARLLVKAEAEVQVIMTEAGAKFVTPLTFESLTNRAVAVHMFPPDEFVGTRHISYAEWPDVLCVAPATADFLARIAGGQCPDLLTTVVCATKRPILLAPAMNEGMYANPAVQKNIALLREYGYHFAEVGTGEMACNSFGAGRMAEPEEIFERIVKLLSIPGPLAGKKVLVTAGPCREALDPVRFISNRSSGKMGFALARQAQLLGAEVTLVTGPVALADPEGIAITRVETTAQMAAAVGVKFGASDYLIMAAAPADYKPTLSFDKKIKKCTDGMTVEFSPTIDILLSLADKKKPAQTVVGFALETDNDLENATGKLASKKLDYIVVNNALEKDAAFDSDTNHVRVLKKGGDSIIIDKADKEIVARKIWEFVLANGDA